MHMFVGPKGTVIHYNGDFSGDVTFTLLHPSRPRASDPPGCHLVDVPAKDLIAFVAEYVRSRKIAALEDVGVDALLGCQSEKRVLLGHDDA